MFVGTGSKPGKPCGRVEEVHSQQTGARCSEGQTPGLRLARATLAIARGGGGRRLRHVSIENMNAPPRMGAVSDKREGKTIRGGSYVAKGKGDWHGTALAANRL